MSAAPLPVPPPRRFVPALVEVNARRGVTIAVHRQPHLARWAVHTNAADGTPATITGPGPGQESNPSNTELAAQLSAAVHSLGVEVDAVYCSDRALADVLKRKTALPVAELSPSPDSLAAAQEGISAVERRLVTGLTLACDASRGRGRNLNGCGWVLAYPDGSGPAIGMYTTSADHGGIRAGELAAIRRGLQCTVNLHPMLRDGTGDITVLSDSKAALSLIERYLSGSDASSEDSVAQKECGKIAGLTRGVNVKFQWVRGHDGHPLNEMADRLAVMARRTEEAGLDELTRARLLANAREDARGITPQG